MIPLWFYVSDHPQIPLFQSGISLRIADKNAVALLVCYRFNTLKQKDIVRTGKSRTKNNDQFFFPAIVFVLAVRQLVPQFSGGTLYLLYRFF